jgi:Protein of unknown function (DUF3014)
MNQKTSFWIPIAVLIALALGLYLWSRQRGEAPPPPPPPAPAAEQPAIKHPVPPVEPAVPPQPLPTLEESDEPLRTELSDVVGAAPVESFLVPDGLVRKFVATVDNLTAKKVAARLLPVKPVAGDFRATRSDGTITLDPGNYDRYKPFVDFVTQADTSRVRQLYFRYYPLFQKAYQDLGYPSGYFNDRTVEVIDHLLATPDVTGPIELTQPSVYYQFADPQLEALSAGQKALIRMGPENEAAVKEKLREVRAAIVGQVPPA